MLNEEYKKSKKMLTIIRIIMNKNDVLKAKYGFRHYVLNPMINLSHAYLTVCSFEMYDCIY